MSEQNNIVVGDAVKALKNRDIDVLLHVTNDQGVMGSGIALQIKHDIPDAYVGYKENHALGEISFGEYCSGGFVINMTAQSFYGKVGSGRFLNYGALSKCLNDVYEFLETQHDYDDCKNVKIGIPVRMGAVRAGGDWEIVKEMVDFLLGRHFTVIYYDFDKG